MQSDLALVPKLANPTDWSPSGGEMAAHKADWSPPGGEIAENRNNMKKISVALVEGEHPVQKTAMMKYSKLLRGHKGVVHWIGTSYTLTVALHVTCFLQSSILTEILRVATR